MIWQTILCFLAACGLVMVIWVFLGARILPLRPKMGTMILLWRAAGGEAELRKTYEALSWLRESGLTPQTMVIWDDGLDECARCAAAAMARADLRVRVADGAQILEIVRESTDGRGTDDSAGHRDGGSLSK